MEQRTDLRRIPYSVFRSWSHRSHGLAADSNLVFPFELNCLPLCSWFVRHERSYQKAARQLLTRTGSC